MAKSIKAPHTRLREENAANKARLRRIREIIEGVDLRCSAADGPVTPTLQEMTQDEMSRIYALATGHRETWVPK